ncbi:MAG: transcriptional regulator NrdR [Candidatus Omnitrophota bacterium]
MKCPFCEYKETKVIDSRISGEGGSIRRRRECLKCAKRFTTYEYVERVPLMVVKKDGRRQAFDRTKIIAGLVKACEKRPVSITRIEEMTSDVERAIQKRFDREVDSHIIGEEIMKKLAGLDEVAYVRFASVYRQFRDVNQFMSELKHILEREKEEAKK